MPALKNQALARRALRLFVSTIAGRCLLAIAATALTAVSAAQAVTIDFEAYPGLDGELGTGDDVPIAAPDLFSSQTVQLTDQFAALGIVFIPEPGLDDKNEILNDSSFTRTVGSRTNLLSTNRLSHMPFGDIDARFTSPVYELTMAIGLSYGGSSSNILEIFDAGGSLIDSAIGTNEFVTLSSAVPIARFQVRATAAGQQAVIDDVTFIPVPEPGSVALAAAAIACSCFCRRLSR